MRDQKTYKIIGVALEVQSTDYPSTIFRSYGAGGAGADYAEMRDRKTYKIIGAALEACRHQPAIGFAFRRGGRVHNACATGQAG